MVFPYKNRDRSHSEVAGEIPSGLSCGGGGRKRDLCEALRFFSITKAILQGKNFSEFRNCILPL